MMPLWPLYISVVSIGPVLWCHIWLEHVTVIGTWPGSLCNVWPLASTSKSEHPCPCQNWKRIFAESSLMSTRWPSQSRDWIELYWPFGFLYHYCRHWTRGIWLYMTFTCQYYKYSTSSIVSHTIFRCHYYRYWTSFFIPCTPVTCDCCRH